MFKLKNVAVILYKQYVYIINWLSSKQGTYLKRFKGPWMKDVHLYVKYCSRRKSLVLSESSQAGKATYAGVIIKEFHVNKGDIEKLRLNDITV